MAERLTPAERQRRFRRRRALGAVVVRVEIPEDVARELQERGVNIDDPREVGEALEDALFA